MMPDEVVHGPSSAEIEWLAEGLDPRFFIVDPDEFDLDPDREWSCPPPRRDVWEMLTEKEDISDL
jgi:hypothetical protein